MEDFADIKEVEVGNTRGSACIDRIFTNNPDSMRNGGTVAPLEVDDGEDGAPSNHRVAYARWDLKKLDAFEWLSYKYMYYNEDSEKKFGNWIRAYDWSKVMAKKTSNEKANLYQQVVTGALEACFPVITTRRKSTELPWINKRIRRLIRRRRAVFKLEGRKSKWKRLKKFTEELIKERRDLSLIHI